MHETGMQSSIDSTLDEIEERSILDQKPGEPDLWHQRRVRYLLMGPTRSVRKTCLAEGQEKGEPVGRVHPGWYQASREWAWESDALTLDREQLQERALSRAAKAQRVMDDNQDALDYALQIARSALSKAKPGSDQQRLWLDTLAKLTAERRKEMGYDKTVIEQSEPTYTVSVPGVSDDAL